MTDSQEDELKRMAGEYKRAAQGVPTRKALVRLVEWVKHAIGAAYEDGRASQAASEREGHH